MPKRVPRSTTRPARLCTANPTAEGGTFVAKTCAQSTDTVLAVVTTCGDALTALTCNDDTANGACPALSKLVSGIYWAGVCSCLLGESKQGRLSEVCT
jgi:hypothetical protein